MSWTFRVFWFFEGMVQLFVRIFVIMTWSASETDQLRIPATSTNCRQILGSQLLPVHCRQIMALSGADSLEFRVCAWRVLFRAILAQTLNSKLSHRNMPEDDNIFDNIRVEIYLSRRSSVLIKDLGLCPVYAKLTIRIDLMIKAVNENARLLNGH